MHLRTLLSLLAVLCLTMQQFDGQPSQLPMYIGAGYNLVSGNPLVDEVDEGFENPIFNLSYSRGSLTEDGRYLIPDEVHVRKSSSCSLSSQVDTFSGTQSYQKSIYAKVGVEVGMKGAVYSGAFSASAQFQSMDQQTSNQKKSVTHATAECQCYALSLNVFTPLPFRKNFTELVEKSYIANNWKPFIDQYGTHFAYDVIMGGRATQQITVTSQSTAKLSSMGIDVKAAAKAKFAKFHADASFDFNKKQKDISYLDNSAQQVKQVYLGGKPPADSNLSSWIDNVVQDPMPIRYRVMELTELIKMVKSNRTDFDAIKAAQQFYQVLLGYCTTFKCLNVRGDAPGGKAYVDHYRTEKFQEQKCLFYDQRHISTSLQLQRIKVRWDLLGSRIMSIQSVFADGVRVVYSKDTQFSTIGPIQEEWVIPDGEYVTQYELYVSKKYGIAGFAFYTNNGTKSPQWGTQDGVYSMNYIPQGFRIIGISPCIKYFKDDFGLQTSHYVYDIMFHLGMVHYGEYKFNRTQLIGANHDDPNYPGTKFEWNLTHHVMQHFKIKAFYDNVINGLQFSFTDGVDVVGSPLIGSNKSTSVNSSNFFFFSGDKIIKTTCKASGVIAQLGFLTDGGRWGYFNAGSHSGIPNITTSSLNISREYKIVGVYGIAGKSVNKLGFIIGRPITASVSGKIGKASFSGSSNVELPDPHSHESANEKESTASDQDSESSSLSSQSL